MIKRNRTSVLLSVILLLISVSCSDDPDEHALKSEAESVIDDLIAAFETFDTELHDKIWFKDQSLRVYGLYNGNNISGWESLMRHFVRVSDKIESSRFEVLYKKLNFSSSLKTAWFSLLANQNYMTDGKQRTINGIRFTGVIERIDGRWRIVQLHGSVPLSIELE